jgi:RNA-directed DNA polymerase
MTGRAVVPTFVEPATQNQTLARFHNVSSESRANVAPWEEVRDRLNHLLRGWATYFSYGTRLMAYRAADNHVYATVRGFLTRRHKVPSRGTRQFSDQVVFGRLGVLRLRRMHIGAPPTVAR